jgi:hypothetical protein
MRNGVYETELSVGWGGRIRTCECRYQKPVPYHLATPQQAIAALREKRRLYRPHPALEGWMGHRSKQTRMSI